MLWGNSRRSAIHIPKRKRREKVMELNRKKNALLLCANIGCRCMATHFFLVQKSNSKPVHIGLCEDCSYELYAIQKLNKGR